MVGCSRPMSERHVSLLTAASVLKRQDARFVLTDEIAAPRVEKLIGVDLGRRRYISESYMQKCYETLRRSSSLESRIRNATKEALKEVQIAEIFCACRKPATGGCRNCLMRKICCCLQTAGFDSTICKSKWKSSPHIPSGEHTFLDVVDNSSSKKGEVRVIIELNFRVEFEMASASEEYNKLITRLPEVFVGKVERLHNLIKILCSAAKKCMKDNKMHIGPWRKHKYMQAKWLSTCERRISTPILSTRHSAHTPRPKASMLTVDLLENLVQFE
ncbi:hypothetical protein HYC85_017863 [Camellia sinensis]|uniref:Uncharacterized protein n=1 Tax=Camellia sinensis TaxID=4442 RepID=A0A7J7GW78_CAMSI|nr:hypothetical protein HYC85_017863 [Camellia sinensis]